MDRTTQGYQFLPIGEAAFILGISRIRLREAVAKGIVPAMRDNEGRIRVDLSRATPDLARQLADSRSDPTILIDALFDEVEELQAMLLERDNVTGRMEDLVRRQDEALAHTVDLLEQAMRQSAGAAIFPAALRAGRTSPASLEEVSDRALAMLDEVTGRLEESVAQNQRYRDLIERAFAFSDAWANATQGREAAMSDAAERAIALLERALHEGEAKDQAAQKLGGLVDRALAAGHLLESEVIDARDKLKRQEQMVGQVLEMSERAVGLVNGQQVRRRGWLSWLTGS